MAKKERKRAKKMRERFTEKRGEREIERDGQTERKTQCVAFSVIALVLSSSVFAVCCIYWVVHSLKLTLKMQTMQSRQTPVTVHSYSEHVNESVMKQC